MKMRLLIPPGAFHFFGFSFLILILILLLISKEEGEEIKIRIRSKIKRGTQKSEIHPNSTGVMDGRQKPFTRITRLDTIRHDRA